jgi:dolichol-phosphate mannosyltransferase
METSVLIVVPTYNERVNLPLLVPALLAHVGVRLLIVDDQSPDGTGAIADELSRQHDGRIDVMHRTGPRGLGRAYVDGLSRAVRQPVDLICQMDADLSHDPTELPRLLAAAGTAEVVIGSRYVAGGAILNWPRRRRWLSRLANVYIRTITGLRPRDCTSGYRCWRREALAKLPLQEFVSDGYCFLVEMLFAAQRQALTVAEVPITFVERRAGESKVSRSVLWESAMMPWRLSARRAGRRPSERTSL